MNRLKAKSMDRKLDQQTGSQINGLKARSKGWMLDHHIEGQINSSDTDEADGSNAKDIANKDASKKAAPKTEKEAAYVLATSIKPVQRDSIKPAQIGSTKTASSGRSKPAGNGKSSLSSETGSSNTVTSKLSDRDVLLAQMPTQALTDMTRPSRDRLKENRVAMMYKAEMYKTCCAQGGGSKA